MLGINNNFVITGDWGSSSDNLNVSGTLTFKSGKVTLVTVQRLSLNKDSTPSIFGIGHIKVEGINTDDIVMISLLGVVESKNYSKTKFFPHNTAIQSSNYEYTALSMFTGDVFVSKDIVIRTVKEYPTNFSAWMHSLQDFEQSKEDSGVLQVSAKENQGYVIKSKDGKKTYSFRRSLVPTQQNQVNQINRTIQITDFFQVDDSSGMSLEESMTIGPMVSSWYQLITNKDENIYCNCFTTVTGENITFFNLSKSVSIQQRDYSRETTVLRRTRQWKENMLCSLVNWIRSYEVLAPIAMAIYPPQTLSVDFRIQTECVAIETIVDNYYKEIKKAYYKKKVSYFMEQVDDFVTVDAFKTFPVAENVDSLADKIKQYRNPLSHNYLQAGIKPLEEKVLLFNVLKAMIRDWTLNIIQIDQKSIKTDFQIFSSIPGRVIKAL